MPEAFVYFVTGMAIGLIVGVFIMAVAMAIGKRRDETDIRESNPLYNNDLIFVKNDEEVIKMDDGKYLIKRRK